MADRPNRVRQQLGNYRLIRLLGEGGFAEVYLAEHIYLKTQVAVKVLQEKMEAQYIEGFLKEAQTIAALKHLHILRVLDFGMENSRPFLVMEYAPGGTLRKNHPRGSKVLLSTVVSYVKQVAMALQYAHDQKIVHRDVKPENVLVEADGKIVLGDFGIATPTHQTQSLSTQETVGTISYMAPEQIQGKPRAASDQYSLGIIVYEWLCGARPFEGATAIEIAMHHLNNLPPSLREKFPSISPDVEQVVMTALAKDAKQRFASVQAFATALEQASQSAESQPSVSLKGNIPPIQPLSPAIPATPPNQSLKPISDILPVNRSYTLEQTSQSEQMQPSVPLAEATLSHQPLPPTLLATPLNPSPEPTTGISPRSHASEVSGTQLPLPQTMSRPSRRTVIVGLVGLTLVGGGITWLATSRSSTSQPIHSMTPTSPTPTPLPRGTTLYTYRGHSYYVYAVAWSPDGKRIASGGDRTVQVWDAVDGGHVFTYQGHSSGMTAVAWSPDGKRIASGSNDNTVQVWDAIDLIITHKPKSPRRGS
jgi:serine/threonine protein kinase